MKEEHKQEIRDFLKKIGLEHSEFTKDDGGRTYIVTSFKIGTYIITNFKQNLKNSLKDLINLCESYIQKVDES